MTDRPSYYPSHDRDPDDHRADVMALVSHWYGCVLSGRPNLLDHQASERERHRVMRVLIADAESLIETVYGDDAPTTLPAGVVLDAQEGD